MSAPDAPGRAASKPALVGWVLFDWACQPFFTLVTSFIYGPYFVTVLASDPIQGQALWGYATAAAGLMLGLLSPVLGSVADAVGPKKPGIAGAGLVLFVGCAALWYAAPGAAYAIPLAMAAFAVSTVAAEVAAVFNNAMMPRLVPPEKLGRLSGAGWATGYAGGLLSLIVVLGFLIADPATGRTYLGIPPLFGLDPGAREGDRFVGPLSAVWFLVFVLPLFLLTPDAPRTRAPLGLAVREGLGHLRGTVAEARRDPRLWRFLLANLVYQDGLVALFAFGGIYGAGVFGWGAAELGVFGILLTITGTVGALVGGRLDDRFGPRAVILGALAGLVFVCVGILSIDRDHILFVIPTGPSVPGRLYSSAPEKLFLGLGLVIGAVAGPLQAASRSLLAHLVPAGEAGRYFGLLSLSGRVTSFVAPFLVATATGIFGHQAAGVSILIVFFTIGTVLISRVHRDP